MKKGVLELADALVVNKADGEQLDAARRAQIAYQHALALLRPASPQWRPPVLLASATRGDGIGRVLGDRCSNTATALTASGELRGAPQRAGARAGCGRCVEEGLQRGFRAHPGVARGAPAPRGRGRQRARRRPAPLRASCSSPSGRADSFAAGFTRGPGLPMTLSVLSARARPADGQDRWRAAGRPGGSRRFRGAGGAMVQINMAAREITLKVVYYGPALSGKTTNLQQLHQLLDPASRGKMVTLDTTDDRTLYFDFLPIQFGAGSGVAVKLKLFTVPGQVMHKSHAQGRARRCRCGRLHRRLAALLGLRQRLLLARHGSQPARQQHRLRRDPEDRAVQQARPARTSSRSRRSARRGARSRPSRRSR